MPTAAHQWLLVWAARRMARDGFLVAGFDGPASHGGMWNALPPAFELYAYRPDAWGFSPERSLIAFAEAKTTHDIDNAHTREQLRVFGFCRMRTTAHQCPIYIAIPRSAVYELDRVLIDTGLIRAQHVIRLHIPDALLEESRHVARKASPRFPAAPARWNEVSPRKRACRPVR